ncbi:MAG TPA: hypothetical protein DCQ14_05725 [Firmicutes bacterium]|nr:hypothetical protein [Bacillota bacterium]
MINIFTANGVNVMSKTVIIIGGNGAGLSAASQIKRLQPAWEMIVYEKGTHISYAGCGMPYYIEGIIPRFADLFELTPETVVKDRKIDLRLQHEVLALNPEQKELMVRTPAGTETVRFDTLLIATGAVPILEGIRLGPPAQPRRVFTLKSMDDMQEIAKFLDVQKPSRCAVIGGGYIAAEMLEAFKTRGLETHLVHRRDQLANTFEPEISALILQRMTKEGIVLNLQRAVQELLEEGDKVVVRTDSGDLFYDFVLIATGVQPNTAFLRQSGIELGIKGAVVVNKSLQTNHPHIYAAGDCAQTTSIITGRPVYVPLAPKANKEGYTAGTNIAGGRDEFPGIVETAVTKFFDMGIARTGLTLDGALQHGFNAAKYTFSARSKARYYPGGGEVYSAIVVNKDDGRFLGAQLTGPLDSMKRIDVYAVMIQQGVTVDEAFKLDLAYSPPFAPLYDPVILAARLGRNYVSR